LENLKQGGWICIACQIWFTWLALLIHFIETVCRCSLWMFFYTCLYIYESLECYIGKG